MAQFLCSSCGFAGQGTWRWELLCPACGERGTVGVTMTLDELSAAGPMPASALAEARDPEPAERQTLARVLGRLLRHLACRPGAAAAAAPDTVPAPDTA